MSGSPQPPPSPRSGDPWAAGVVTAPGIPPAAAPPPARPPVAEPAPLSGPRRRRRDLLIFGGIAAAILVLGLVVLLVVVVNGGAGLRDRAAAPSDVRPPLARLCAAPSAGGTPAPEGSPPPRRPSGAPAAGPRTVDPEAGISYRAYPAPWEAWRTTWRAGTLEVPYRTGQHFVTEIYSGGTYHASILSAAVPAADNDAVTLDLQCVGQQVVADVRAEYYPQPTTMDPIRNGMTRLGGRPAWLSVFRLHFHSPGLTATDEFVAVGVIDVGKPTAAVLYVSIPGTHRRLDWVVDDVLASVRAL